jgi:hypothetical protein
VRKKREKVQRALDNTQHILYIRPQSLHRPIEYRSFVLVRLFCTGCIRLSLHPVCSCRVKWSSIPRHQKLPSGIRTIKGPSHLNCDYGFSQSVSRQPATMPSIEEEELHEVTADYPKSLEGRLLFAVPKSESLLPAYRS